MRTVLSKIALPSVMAVSITISAFSGDQVQAQSNKNYILATASTGGTYYPVGVALSTLIKVKLQKKHKINLSAINSAGSGENVKLLRDKEAQFAILQGLYGYYAATGTGPLKKVGKQKKLRSITMLWQNVEHFVIPASKVKTGTITDLVELKGQTVAFGKRNSGTIGSNRTILEAFGLSIDKDYKLFYGGYGPSAKAVQNGKALAMGTPAGVPVGAVTSLTAALKGKVALLSFTNKQAEQADGGRGLWAKYVIPAGTYPGISKDISTIAQPNFLATTSDMSDDDVYLITKTIYNNLPFLNAIHKATKAMSIEKAIAGLPVPLHPGAVRFYKEAGIKIPVKLIAK